MNETASVRHPTGRRGLALALRQRQIGIEGARTSGGGTAVRKPDHHQGLAAPDLLLHLNGPAGVGTRRRSGRSWRRPTSRGTRCRWSPSSTAERSAFGAVHGDMGPARPHFLSTIPSLADFIGSGFPGCCSASNVDLTRSYEFKELPCRSASNLRADQRPRGTAE